MRRRATDFRRPVQRRFSWWIWVLLLLFFTAGFGLFVIQHNHQDEDNGEQPLLAVVEEMRKLRVVQELLCMFPAAAAYTCTAASCLTCVGKNSKSSFLIHDDDDDPFGDQIKPLIPTSLQKSAPLKLKDALAINPPTPTLAFHLKPKMVVLKVSMHCNGCARKVEKHISKLEGVSSYEIDMETKMVVVRGDIVPFEVLESVSKVKYAELWEPHDES